jgi:leucine-rich repeat protein SHOC2
LGYEEICNELGAVSIDSWQEYTLLKLDNMEIIYERQKEIRRESMMLLKMTCPSTSHIHILRVPSEMVSAEAAIT